MKPIFIGIFVVLVASVGLGQAPQDAASLVERAAQNQGHSLFVRDRCRYEQRLLMERYKYDKKKQVTGELLARRQTTVVVEPAAAPDESGLVPVVARVVAGGSLFVAARLSARPALPPRQLAGHRGFRPPGNETGGRLVVR